MKEVRSNNWRVSAQIECGNAAAIEPAGPDHFRLRPREDPVPHEVQVTGPISTYVLCVAVTNESPTSRSLVLEVMIPPWLAETGFDYVLRKPYLLRPSDELSWRPVEADRQEDLPSSVRIRLDVEPGRGIVVSTVPSYPYSQMRDELNRLAEKSGGAARVVTYGQSLEGRALLSLEVGRGQAPHRVVFSGSTQPGEPCAWAVLAMANALLDQHELRERYADFDISFIPQPNPDGIAHGCCNVNLAGEMIFLGYDKPDTGDNRCHEARQLWDYLSDRPPMALLDFHFLHLVNHLQPAPYVFDGALYTDPARRRLAERITQAICELNSAEPKISIADNHPLWKGLLTYQAVRQWNTAATLYQNTGPQTSVEQAQRRGVEAMRAVLDACLEELAG